MKHIPLNRYEAAILRHLRRSESARFSDLMRTTDLESDSFKFYLRKVQKDSYVEKTEAGDYRLTVAGKEFANSIDDDRVAIQKQPKLSMIIIASRLSDNGVEEYLAHQRARHPYWGYWGFFSGRVQWGEHFEDTAAAEFQKQTGLQASMEVASFYHKHDMLAEGRMVEDILFVIIRASDPIGALSHEWKGGQNKWMTLDELAAQDHVFADTEEVLNLLKSKKPYAQSQLVYEQSRY